MGVPTNLIPTPITGLPEYTGSETIGYLPYVIDGRTFKVQFSNIAAAGAVPASRVIAAGTGLAGGGDLSANRVISIAAGGVGFDQLAVSGVAQGTYGSGSDIPVLTVDAKGRVTSATTAALNVTGFVPTSRTILAGDGLVGGGSLASNLTFSANFSAATPSALGTASAGTAITVSRGDHVHPAVDLSDTTQTQGALPLGRGGTGDALSPVAGAVVYSTGTKFALTDPGLPGQFLLSNGTGEPQWQTVSGSGTVTSVSVATANGFAGTVANPNIAAIITLQTTVNGILKGDGTGVSASIITDNGTNVGIGTASPTQKLSVNGDAVVGVAGSSGFVYGNRTGNIMVGEDAGGSYVFSGSGGTSPPNLYIGTRNTTTIFQTDAGQERMRIASGGNVGISTSAPVAKLDVVTGIGNGTINESNCIRLRHTATVSNAMTLQIGVNNTGAGDLNQGYSYLQSAYWGGGFNPILLNPQGGSVGIGASYATAKLSVVNGNIQLNQSGTSQQLARIGFNGAGVGLVNAPAFMGAFADNGIWSNGLALTFNTIRSADVSGSNGTERMRITSAGSVLINTTASLYGSASNPSLELNGATGALLGLKVANAEGSYIQHTTDLIIANTTANSIRFFANGSERMRITSAGLVGVGTTTPAGKFDVSSSGEPDSYLSRLGLSASHGASGVGQLYFRDINNAYNTSSIQSVGYMPGASGALTFKTTKTGTLTERVRITEDGFVGIGTNSPTIRLSVVGDGRFTNTANTVLSVGGGTGQASVVVEGPSATTSVSLFHNGSGAYLIQNGGTSGFNFRNTAGDYTFSTGAGNTERVRIDTNGKLLVGTTAAQGSADVVATQGFNSRFVAVGANATVTVTVPVGCICIIGANGFSQDGAIFALKTSGGSQGAAVIAQNTAGAYAFGTTTDPNSGSRTDLWVSATTTLSIKDKTGTARNFSLTFISLG